MRLMARVGGDVRGPSVYGRKVGLGFATDPICVTVREAICDALRDAAHDVVSRPRLEQRTDQEGRGGFTPAHV